MSSDGMGMLVWRSIFLWGRIQVILCKTALLQVETSLREEIEPEALHDRPVCRRVFRWSCAIIPLILALLQGCYIIPSKSIKGPDYTKYKLPARTLPRDIHEADSALIQRKNAMVLAWVANFGLTRSLEKWDENGKAALRKLAAGFYAFSRKGEFNSKHFAILSGLNQNAPYEAHLSAFQEIASEYFKTIHIFETLGTAGLPGKNGGDYDFLLKEILPLIFNYARKPSLLTNDMVWHLLTQRENSNEFIPFTGQDYQRHLSLAWRHKKAGLTIKAVQPETENHVLMILGYQYFINHYIRWGARLDPADPRFDKRIVQVYKKHPDRYENTSEFTDFILQILGRVVHQGLFETNSKAYESFSFNAILNFYDCAGHLDTSDADQLKIKTAAKNALDYISAKFAFQSLEGKRVSPMRRNWTYRERLGVYDNDYLPNMLGIFSGAYVFNDDNGLDIYPDTALHPNKELLFSQPYFFGRLSQPAGFALWAALSNYRLPAVIHDFMLHTYKGWWASFQSRYSSAHYSIKLKVKSGPQLFRRDGTGVPVYFENGGQVTTGSPRMIFHQHFVAPQFMNTGGGNFNRYYRHEFAGFDLTLFAEELRAYDGISRPVTLMTRGNNGYWGSRISSVRKEALNIPGLSTMYFAESGMSLYKSFAFGYAFAERFYQQWPHRFPSQWEKSAVNTVNIGDAQFSLFDFRQAASHPLSGHYLILGRMRPHKRRVSIPRLGWWEVVPGHRFDHSDSLAQYIRLHHTDKGMDNLKRSFPYVMASTGEKLLLNGKLGTEDQCRGILKVWTGPALSGEKFVDETGLSPCEDRDIGTIPLFNVWQVDENYHLTGYRYAHGDGKGYIEIRNPHLGELERILIIDSRNYRYPTNFEW